ncbi:MAG TPA: MMPL family transporter [Micromonosporaceae bacterium]
MSGGSVLFARLGRSAARRRWWVVAAWSAVLLAGLVFSGPLFDRLTTVDSLRGDAESVRAEQQIADLVDAGPVLFAVVAGVDPYHPDVVADVSRVADQVRAMPEVGDVADLYTSPGGQIGADNRSTLIRVELVEHLPDDRLAQAEDRVRAALNTIRAPSVLVGGDHLAERAFGEQALADLVVGESVAFAVLLVALVVIFGGVLAASLPVSVAIVAVSATMLALLGVSAITPVGEYSLNIVTLLGIGLAVDYALLIVARYREERATGLATMAAVEAAMSHAGRAVAFAGTGVAVALVGLAAFGEPLLASMAVGGTLVALISTLLALTLVPALIAVAGDRIPPAGAQTAVTRAVAAIRQRWSRLRPRWSTSPTPAQPAEPASRPTVQLGSASRPTVLLGSASRPTVLLGSASRPTVLSGSASRPTVLLRLATLAQRRPGPIAALTIAGLILLALPLLGASFANSDARALPAQAEARRAYETYRSLFAPEPVPVTVVAIADAASVPVREYLNQLNQLPGVQRLDLRPDVPAGAVIIDLVPTGDGASAHALVRAVRSAGAPFPALVAGPAAEVVDYQDSVASRLPYLAIVLVVAMVVLLYLMTGSLVVPVKAVVLNALTFLASVGVVVALFGWGWGEAVLGFDSWGAVDLTTPLLLFVFLLGLTMDYEVFLLSRIKEEYDQHHDNDRAVLTGIARSGPVVTAAAWCITIVFLGFAAGDLVAVKELGVGMAVAVILDVTVIRGLLLPAAMTLLGDLNWWSPAPRTRARLRALAARAVGSVAALRRSPP